MKPYTFNDFTIDSNFATLLNDDQLWISAFNMSVSDTFKDMALKALNNYISHHQDLVYDKSDLLIAILVASFDNDLDKNERYFLLIFLCNEDKGLEKEITLKIPLLPNKDYFYNFKQLVMSELEQLIF